MRINFKKILGIILLFCVNHSFSQNFDYLPKSNSNQVIKHSYYTLSYSEEFEQAEWVAYMITSERVKGMIKRNDKFISDPFVASKSANSNDYKKSGFDRGHLAPAADMKFDEIAMKECFYMSNISPQLPSFNRGIWKELEEKLRNWALNEDTLYVITAGILTNIDKRIGENRVGVPKFFYKIILKYTKNETKAIAFCIPNQKSEKSIYEYVVSIDKIEELTGIDFFPKLPDKLESKLESQINTDLWR